MALEDKEQELKRREQELRQKEQELRLRELEAELHRPPIQKPQAESPHVSPTTKYDPDGNKVKAQGKRRPMVKKIKDFVLFIGIVIAVVAAVRVAASLASILIVGLIAWIGYKLFLDRD